MAAAIGARQALGEHGGSDIRGGTGGGIRQDPPTIFVETDMGNGDAALGQHHLERVARGFRPAALVGSVTSQPHQQHAPFLFAGSAATVASDVPSRGRGCDGLALP